MLTLVMPTTERSPLAHSDPMMASSTFRPPPRAGRVLLVVCLPLLFAVGVAHAQNVAPPPESADYAAWKQSQISPSARAEVARTPAPRSSEGSALLFPYPGDGGWTELPRNDDGSSGVMPLGFDFQFYGSTYQDICVNNNGNISFSECFSSFTSTGFPSPDFRMVAPFWADVDTGCETCGLVYYQQTTYEGVPVFVAHWEAVGYFSSSSDKVNTFQVVIADSEVLPGGNSVCFGYGDMQWTTGSASGGTNGFGGTPATVGANAGDGENFFLVGRFDHEGTDYDGPGGGADGVSYLEDTQSCFNVGGIVTAEVDPVVTGDPAEVRVTVGGIEPTVAELRYRPSGTTEYTSVDLSFDGEAYTGTIPPEAVTLRGISYYVFFSDGERTVTYPVFDPEANPAQVRVQIDQQAADVDLPRDAQYRMVSVPAVLNDPDPGAVFEDDYGEYGASSWRLLRWVPGLEQYAELEVLVDSLGMPDSLGTVLLDDLVEPGTAFWLAAYADEPFDIDSALSVEASAPVTMTLQPGWNQIGNPFAFPVAWSDVVGRDLVQPPAFYDGTEYLLDQPVLEPWAGYFVNVPDSAGVVTLQVPPIEAGSAPPTRSSRVAEAGYRVRLRAEGPGHDLRDTQNVFGFAEAAEAERLTLAEPPPIGPHLRLSAVEDPGSSPGQAPRRLAHSFRPAGGDGGDWELEVTATPSLLDDGPLTVRVALEELGARPAGYALHVLDLDRTVPVPLDDGAFELTLSAEQPVRRLRLIAGTDTYAEAAREGVPLEPLAFALAPAYPNPFARSATLTYQVAERSDVTLEVFDLLGRRVAILADGLHDAGRYTVRWDGRSAAGSRAANGVYVYRLRAGSFSVSQKVVLLR